MKTNSIFVQQSTVSTPRATTTVAYTTTTCACVVTGQPSSFRVIVDSGDVERASIALAPPTVSISACYGSKFLGYRISVLPTLGTLRLGTVPVVLNQVISRQDFPRLNYTVTANTPGTDSISYVLLADCGTSSTLAISLVMIAENPAVDGI